VTAGPPLTTRQPLALRPKKFIEPPRTNDPRTDFFALYRREFEEFDGDYARKYDEDLDTPLILVSGSTFSFDTEG